MFEIPLRIHPEILPMLPSEFKLRISSKIRFKISQKTDIPRNFFTDFSLDFRNYSTDSLEDFSKSTVMLIQIFFYIPTKNLSKVIPPLETS